MPRIFVSSALVDRWLSDGRARLEGDMLDVDATGQRMLLHLEPAVFFERVDGTHADAHELVGVVRSNADLEAMGAEHFETSVLFEDQAYTVQPGFTAVPMASDGTQRVLTSASWHGFVADLLRLTTT